MSGRLVCALAVAAISALTSPARSDSIQATDAFVNLCIKEAYLPGSSDPPIDFPSARKMDPADLGGAAELASFRAALTEVWDLDPTARPSGQMIVATGLMDHPSMGPLEVCMVMARQGQARTSTEALLSYGADREGDFLFLDGPARTWMIKAGGMPSNGGVIIVGMSPKASP